MIRSPTLPRGHPDRLRECEKALEEETFALYDRFPIPSREEIEAISDQARTGNWPSRQRASVLIDIGGRCWKSPGDRK